ncbi:MAG: GAF domain-containing protein [Planctomycetes bacterium]|nr:GAF domain-containing protein [Planctomycetota bacterium]
MTSDLPLQPMGAGAASVPAAARPGTRCTSPLERANALLEVTRRLAVGLRMAEMLPPLAALFTELLDVQCTIVFLYDADRDELRAWSSERHEAPPAHFPKDQGIAGVSFTSDRSLLIPDASADPRFRPEVDLATGIRTRNLLSVPLRSGHDAAAAIGVVQVLNKRSGDFDPDDLAWFETLVRQAASEFVKALLYEEVLRTRREDQRLFEVTTALAREIKLDPLLAIIMETAGSILEVERATLFLFDPRTNELWTRVSQDSSMKDVRFPADRGIAGAAFASGRTVHIPDAYADPRFNQEIDRQTGFRTRSILCMPVLNKLGTGLGVLEVLNKVDGAFSPGDERRLAAFCAQAAVALENAQLFEEVLRVKNYNERILQCLSNGVITLDPEGRVVKANEAALKLLGLDARPEALLGREAESLFAGPNAWLARAIAAVQATGRPESALDAELVRTWLPTEEGATRRAHRASVNLSAVPLADPGAERLGSLVVLEDVTREKRLRSTMGRYMSKDLVDRLLSEGEDRLGGRLQKASVIFTDIRDFTDLAERLGPTRTVALLNDYFTVMVDLLLSRGGLLDKFIGDAMLAVFGVPFAGPEDADAAVRTAIEMLRALRTFNARRSARGETAVRMGIGINTDDILSGNIGSLKRMEFTVIGDGVNLASRLEGANKLYGTELLISEFTAKELRGAYRLREIDLLRVRGKTRPVKIFEVLDAFGAAEFPHLDQVITLSAQGLSCYRQRAWREAREPFARALELHPADGVSRRYLERCDEFARRPPPEEWDGVWTMDQK